MLFQLSEHPAVHNKSNISELKAYPHIHLKCTVNLKIKGNA